MNENTACPDNNPNNNCQPKSDSHKAKNKHGEDVKRADHQKMKGHDKDKDSVDKKAEKAQLQAA
uniref:hypothetical protein n=1 Tax=Candidatus Electronema sp. TaxID=2698783 RepID=UPI004057A495